MMPSLASSSSSSRSIPAFADGPDRTRPAAHVLLPGQLVGPYRILGTLGRGGMSEVFWAVHRDLERQAALKVLHPQFAHLSTQLLHEGRVANRVAHPGLVEVYEFGTLPDGIPYIVMELLRGRTLGRYLREEAPVSLALSLHLFEQVAAAMAAAHRKGVIHRDLKPDNVMVMTDGEHADDPQVPVPRIKILDFGLAKLADRPSALSTNGMTLGTPEYMAPEQCMGAAYVDGQVDVYSLGVMIYEALSGRLPFNAERQSEIMSLHVSAEAPPLLRLDGPRWPPALVSLVERMLAKDPLLRPQMDDVARDLAHLQREQGPPAAERAPRPTPASLGRRITRFTDQHPTQPYGQLARRRVLVVDDSPEYALDLQAVLAEEGYECRVLHQGDTALQEVRAFRPDAVLLDVDLPGRTGFRVCWDIKSAPDTKDVLVALISGLTEDTDHKMGLAMKADAYVDKPFLLDDLLAVLRFLLSQPAGPADPDEAPAPR